MNIVTILLLSASIYSVANACLVQTDKGGCCHFPFQYQGIMHYKCTSINWNQPWCSLTANYDQDGQWGNCLDCSTVQTDNGGCCHFPFHYQGVIYNQCTSANWIQPWCSLTANYDQDRQWGNCPATPPLPTPPPQVTPPPPATPPPEGDNCGNRPAGTRIVGGVQAQKDSWPWQAMLARRGGSQFCGGSLIDEHWVLTAAHCVDGVSSSQIVVRMGAYRIDDTAQELQVNKILMHESYHSPKTYAHDIALLKLSSPATLGEGVGLVCLPDDNFALEEGKRCYITGWGTLASGGSQPDYLQEASVPIVSENRCKNSYGSDKIHESMLCAGLDAGGIDACQGDSGGPLVCEFSGKWYLEGATSWGYGCAARGYYGVYARVRYLKTWVENTMSSN